jgi:predicted transcriptional regulator
MKPIILLSIQPEFASMIFEGNKTVELRRRFPKISEGHIVFVYASSPQKELLGSFEVTKIVEETPRCLWRIVKNDAGITKGFFDDYFANATIGYGIFLKNATRFDNPISLDELREKWASFTPPQSYRYLPVNHEFTKELLG